MFCTVCFLLSKMKLKSYSCMEQFVSVKDCNWNNTPPWIVTAVSWCVILSADHATALMHQRKWPLGVMSLFKRPPTSLWSSMAALANFISSVSGSAEYRLVLSSFLPPSLYFTWRGQKRTESCHQILETSFLFINNPKSWANIQI